MLELVSAAGSPEAVVAAVQNGADAVYFASGSFTGQRLSHGFTKEEYEDSLRYCRVRGCKAYVALNILASDAEITEVIRTAENAASLGADALIVRDIGLARVLRTVLPDMPLHGDWSMGLGTLAGVCAAAELGFSRVILPQEIPRDQIEQICTQAPIHAGVFIQNELCVCDPGICYMSSLAGGHSANRGLCSGMCRGNFSLGGRKDDRPLAMKDWSLLPHVEELESLGVRFAVVGGRTRRAEYTALATSIYHNLIHDGKRPTQDELELLCSAFCSQGLTDGYFRDNLGSNMFGYHQPSISQEVSRGLSQIRDGYTEGEKRRVSVSFYAMINEGERSKFVARDDEGHQAAVFGPIPIPAEGNPLNADELSQVLYKTAGTPYFCSGVEARIANNQLIPEADLAAVRHALLLSLSEKRRADVKPRTRHMPDFPRKAEPAEKSKIIFQLTSASQLTPELISMKPDYLYLPIDELAEKFDQVAPYTRLASIIAVLPPVVRDDETAKILAILKKLKALGINEVMIGSLGQLPIVRSVGMLARGDYALNVFNSFTADLLRRAGLQSCTASFELHIGQLRELRTPLDTEIIIYGRLPVMTTENCLIKNSAGKCACQSPGQLSDGKGSVYPVVREFGCRNTVFSSHKLFLADRRADYEGLGFWGLRLLFTTESARECVEVARSYLGISDYRPNGLTRGRMYKGVD